MTDVLAPFGGGPYGHLHSSVYQSLDLRLFHLTNTLRVVQVDVNRNATVVRGDNIIDHRSEGEAICDDVRLSRIADVLKEFTLCYWTVARQEITGNRGGYLKRHAKFSANLRIYTNRSLLVLTETIGK